MTSKNVKENIATSSQISTKNFYGLRSSRFKIGIGEYGFKRDEIDTGVEVLNDLSEEEFSPKSANSY